MLKLMEIETDKLKIWTGRPKQSRDNCAAVMESIKTFGFLVPVLCDSRYEVISGHVRVMAARRLGVPVVPVIVLPLKGWKRRAFAIADNELSRKRSWKQSDIGRHLVRLSGKGFSPAELGFECSAIDALLGKEKTIHWRSVDHQTKRPMQHATSCLTVRVPADAKGTIISRARTHARKKGIGLTAMPSLMGAVVMDLLGARS